MPSFATMKGATFSIAVSSGQTPSPQVNDLDAAAFAALTWLAVPNCGAIGEFGPNTNIIAYDTLDTAVTNKQKGITNAGDPVVEFARSRATDGQTAMRTAGDPLFKEACAFRVVYDDTDTAGGTKTFSYLRGIVSGPVTPNGRNEDFVIDQYTLGLVQTPVTVLGAN